MATEFEYDEEIAISHIKKSLPTEIQNKFSDDEILFIIDCIWDFYEENGYLDISKLEDDDDELDIDQLCNYVIKAVKKDGQINIEKEEIKFVIQGELDYEESLDMLDN